MTLTSPDETFRPLGDVSVVELAEWICGPYAGKLLADLGARVVKVEVLPDGDPARRHDPGVGAGGVGRMFEYLNLGKDGASLTPTDHTALDALFGTADVLLLDRDQARVWGVTPGTLRARFPRLVVVSISPYGLSGPLAEADATDLTLWHEGGYGHGFPGLVADPEKSPSLNGPGHAALHLAGVAAAGAALDGLLRRDDRGEGLVVDFSQLEAVAAVQFGPIVDGQRGNDRSRRAVPDAAPVPAVAILRCADGLVAISPREQHQWLKWVEAIGHPAWAEDERYATVASRGKNWDEVWSRVEEWTAPRSVEEVYRHAQATRVPCLPLNTLDRVRDEPQLASRGFFREVTGWPVPAPTVPFHFDGHTPKGPRPAPRLGDRAGPTVAAAERPRGDRRLPLEGVRVLDLSWVLTGPTCTRLLAQLGAEVIKVESRKRPDLSSREWIYPSLHTGKKSCTLDLSTDGGREVLLRLAAVSDIVIENFSTGVMEKLGLGNDALHAANPELLIVSSSPFGRTGPNARDLAYGSLIQSFMGWGELSRHPGEPEHQFGAIWGDPLSGMTLAYIVLAVIHARRAGKTGGHVLDLSMAEAMIAALTVPYAESSITGRAPTAVGNRDLEIAPQGAYRCRGEDDWVVLSVRDERDWKALRDLVGPTGIDTADLDEAAGRRARHDEIDAAIGDWAARLALDDAVTALRRAGVPAGTIAKPTRLVANPQLHARGFFLTVLDAADPLVAGLAWTVDDEPRPGTTRCPEVGEHNTEIFGDLLGLDEQEIARLEEQGVIR